MNHISYKKRITETGVAYEPECDDCGMPSTHSELYRHDGKCMDCCLGHDEFGVELMLNVVAFVIAAGGVSAVAFAGWLLYEALK